MLIKQMVVTPAKAREMLEQNIHNRPMHHRRISQYARDMKEGRWKQSGDPIRFAIDGRLLDGQHRLNALIKANTPLNFVCIYDLDESVFEVIDTGKIRNGSDVLAMQGVKNRAVVAAAARHQYYYESGAFNGGDASKALIPATNQDVVAMVAEHPGILDSASKLTGYNTIRGLMPPSLCVFFHYNFGRVNLVKCEEFFLILEGRVSDNQGSAALKLRQRLVENKIAKAKFKQSYTAALVIKAWNAFVSGSVIKNLNFKSNEEFPTFE